MSTIAVTNDTKERLERLRELMRIPRVLSADAALNRVFDLAEKCLEAKKK